jgi:hypothetical protein
MVNEKMSIDWTLSLSIIPMASSEPPHKRKRTGRKARPLVEGDDSTLDTAMYQELGPGTRRHKVLVPIRLDEPTLKQPTPEPEPDPILDVDIEMDWDCADKVPKTQQKTKTHYMKEFVSRINNILASIQAREALPDPNTCSSCHTSIGKWRCQDCSYGLLMCRKCMRHSHFMNPFHRISRWTGSYFQDAALWEVGLYLTAPHKEAPGICPILKSQQEILEKLQQQRDHDDQFLPPSISSVNEEAAKTYIPRPDPEPEPEPDPNDDATRDAAMMGILDQLLEGHDVDSILAECEDDENAEPDIEDLEAGGNGFVGYTGLDRSESGPDTSVPNWSEHHISAAPLQDALNNQYVRVVHTNGLHHIALVSCACQGHENITMDLIYAQLIPTSFDRIRTLFTTAVLDQFRFCNLEMKSSAYQFFQLLRRITMPMNPSRVVNLYHELRRLSRLWRWTKKLKWAGFAQKPDQPINPNPGQLANYCPACPQVGINIAPNWLQDQNRWVYRRVFTADGNFKANHVRQRGPGDDIWLYDGWGMTTRRPEYKLFLKAALEFDTVSVIQLY